MGGVAGLKRASEGTRRAEWAKAPPYVASWGQRDLVKASRSRCTKQGEFGRLRGAKGGTSVGGVADILGVVAGHRVLSGSWQLAKGRPALPPPPLDSPCAAAGAHAQPRWYFLLVTSCGVVGEPAAG
jgi:hypothetical protein